MAGIKDYSPTPASNTDLFPEGMAPSAVNDGMRQVQADIRAWYNNAEWVIYGDGEGAHTITYVSGTSFAVAGADVTGEYHAGRRVKAVGSTIGVIYGTIESSTFVTDTTVEVAWDSGSLVNEDLTIYLGILRARNPALPNSDAARTSLGLGTLATQDADDVAITGGSATFTGPTAIESDSATASELLVIEKTSGTAYADDNKFLLTLRSVAAATDAVWMRWLASARSHALGIPRGESDFVLRVNTTGVAIEAMRVNGTTGKATFAEKINAAGYQIDGATVYPAAYWARIKPDGTLLDGFNIAAVSKDGTGRYDVIFDRDFASANYAPGAMLSNSTGNAIIGTSGSPGTGAIEYIVWGADGAIRDPDQGLFVWGFGDKA